MIFIFIQFLQFCYIHRISLSSVKFNSILTKGNIYKFMNSLYKNEKRLFIIKLSMESKWVTIVRERFEDKRGRLDLTSNEIRDNDIPDLIEACRGVHNRIKDLNLKSNKIGAGAKYLLAANFLDLTQLNLWGNSIGAEGAKHLSAANFNLAVLYLHNNNIGAKGAKYLSAANFNLAVLYLHNKNIGAEGAKYLSAANFPNLAQLSLWNNNIGAEGTKYLSTGKFPNLKELILKGNNIGAEGVKQLSATNFLNLTHLSLSNNSIKQPNQTYLRMLFGKNNLKTFIYDL